MNKQNSSKGTPLFKVFRREKFNSWAGFGLRALAVFLAFLISLIIVTLIVKDNPIKIVGTLFQGAFNMPWVLLFDTAILLGFGLAIVPAFKMKFWNMGANGQVLIGCLAAVLVMFYWGGKLEIEYGKNIPAIQNVLLILVMFLSAMVASILWAVIPAIFKAFFNTNETLFTLMMNYIAMKLVAYFNYVMAQGKKETPGIINSISKAGWINLKFLPPTIKNYILPIIVIALIAVFIYIYITRTKQGYEVTVLGDSVNTAKYVGMNVKWITIRTLLVSGIICGIIGFLYATCVNHSVTENLCGSTGFTAVLVAWLSNFNPLIMAGISFFLIFLTRGTSKITSIYRLGSNDLSSVIIGLIFFAILISEFFIRYRIKFNRKKKEVVENKEVA